MPVVRGREAAVLGPQLNVCADCRQMVLQVEKQLWSSVRFPETLRVGKLSKSLMLVHDSF